MTTGSSYIDSYYNANTTWNSDLPLGITNGLFELTFGLTEANQIKFNAYSKNINYSTSANLYVSLSETIPKSLAEMQNAPVYARFTCGASAEKTITFPSSLDRNKKYYLLFYSNSAYGGYTGVAMTNIRFEE